MYSERFVKYDNIIWIQFCFFFFYEKPVANGDVSPVVTGTQQNDSDTRFKMGIV